MKFKFFFLLLFLKSASIHSKNDYQKSVASLRFLIYKEQDTTKKIDSLWSLFKVYSDYDPTKSEKIYNEIFQIARKTKSRKLNYIYFSNKARRYSYNNNYKLAAVYAKKANTLLYDQKDWDNYILSCIDYSIYLSYNDKTDKAITILNQALSIARKTKSKNIARIYYGLCYQYNGLSSYTIALKYAKKAIELEKNKFMKIKNYYIIANIYNSLYNFKNAMEYNDLAEKNCNSPYFLTKIKFHKAKILFNKKHYKEALSLAFFSKNYFKKNNYIGPYYDTVFFISDCYFNLKKYQLANKVIDESLNTSFKRRNFEIGYRYRKAKVCLALNDFKTCKKQVNYIISFLLKKDDFFEQRVDIYNIKAQLEENLGNYKQALFYTQKANALNEKFITNFNKNKLNQLQVELDVTEKNNRIKNLQIAHLEKQLEINSINDYLVFISISFIVVLLLALFYIRNNKIIQKKNYQIESEKKIVSKSLQEKETLLKEIHHRVKNNMQLVMSVLNIQAQDENQNISDFMQISRSRILSMALIHENLYQSENLSNVNFKTYVENLTQTIKNTLNNNQPNIDIQININAVYLDTQIAIPLGLIINELVSNAYKYAFPNNRNGLILIQLITKKHKSELIIKDDGIGMTSKTHKKTLGLQLVEDLVFQIDGQMTILNKNGLEYKIRFDNTNIKTNRYE